MALHNLVRRALQQAQAQGLSQAELARAIGVSQATVYKYLTSDPKSELATIKKFARWMNVSLDTLTTTAAEKIVQFSTAPMRLVPVLNRAACGKWRDFSDLDHSLGHADRHEAASTNDPHAFFVVAAGDSMSGSKIDEGDLLLVEPGARVLDGHIVLARNHAGCTVKKFYRHADRVELRPMNESHKSLFVEEDPSLVVYRITQIVKKV